MGNLVNLDDLRWLARRGSFARLTRQLRLGEKGRVIDTWGHVRETCSHWYDLPLVVKHRALKAGAGYGDHVERLFSTILNDSNDLTALSVGFGTGQKEIRWARTGRFSRLDAFDLTDELVDEASRNARAAAVDVNFFRADIFSLPITPGAYDMVIFEDALHHLTPLDCALEHVKALLRPGGLVVVNDFVGPSRFQWTKQQLAAADGILAGLPEKFRQLPDGTVKQRARRPSRLRMRLLDPSEAAESSQIRSLLNKGFDVLLQTPLGGTIVYLVLDEIAQNFTTPEGASLLEAMLTFEDALINDEDLPSDYFLVVGRTAADV